MGAPLVFVHGGGEAAWVWDEFLAHFAGHGRDCYAFDWFGHGGSRTLTDAELIQRSLFDITEELGIVVSRVGPTPVLIGHSMGALVVQKYAEDYPVAARVLLAPAAFKEAPAPDFPLPLDFAVPLAVPPFEFVRQAFFADCTEADARRYYAMITPESPKAFAEVGRADHLLELDRLRLGGPSLVVAGEHDMIVPVDVARRTAEYFGSDYLFLHGRGHGMTLGSESGRTADRIRAWLDTSVW
ncbi:alpha/beta hydrolase [Actinoplanes sp. TBRC 11911]|uniref:alpha/beta hydrolase n=1 Tax=Actinoplanes sp. TBRC 11911 TaxID=2729386 RepID=UPI001B7D730F|nr:alpha/beta fold hydrolase [Actinoplanes sp. TBRC 11911]